MPRRKYIALKYLNRICDSWCACIEIYEWSKCAVVFEWRAPRCLLNDYGTSVTAQHSTIADENKAATVGRYFLKNFMQTQTLQYNLLRTSKYRLVINLQNYLIRKIFIENVFWWLGTPGRPFNRLVSESWKTLLIHSNCSILVNCSVLMMWCRLIVAFDNEFAKIFIQPEIPHARYLQIFVCPTFIDHLLILHTKNM